MISGPVFPRTRDGLLDLLERQADCIERGLVVVDRDLEFDGGAIEALAKDAGGRPVFVLFIDPQAPADIGARVLAARAWLAVGLPLLARARPRTGLDYGQPPRLIALGFDLSTSALQQLAELPAGAIEVLQLRPFRIGGEVLVGVQALLGVTGLAPDEGFHVPSGITAPAARALAARYLDLMQRLEPKLEVGGDRYSRSFRCGGAPLADLSLHDGVLRVCVGAGGPGEVEVLQLATRADCARAVDRIARGYLRRAVADAAPSGEWGRAPDGEAATPEPIAARLSLEPLRRSTVAARQLTEEEYTILGEPVEEDG